MITTVREKRADGGGQNVLFEHAIADQALEREAFDVVMAFSLLYLIVDIPAVLRSVRKPLKTSGIFLSKPYVWKDAAPCYARLLDASPSCRSLQT